MVSSSYNIPMQLGKLLAEGCSAEIYVWGEEQVLKLYRLGWGKENADYEQNIARIVSNAGMNAPAVGKMLEVDGRYGVVYKQVEGTSMLWDAQARPWRAMGYARQLADLHAEMHAINIPELPSLCEALRSAFPTLNSFQIRLRMRSLIDCGTCRMAMHSATAISTRIMSC